MDCRHRTLTIAALMVLSTASASATDAKPDYATVFAEAEVSSYEVNIAGTYDVRSEVLVRLRNRNQYAVPVPVGSDLSKWRENAPATVTIAQGVILDVVRADANAEPFVYEVLTAEDMVNLPADLVAREVTYAIPVRDVDIKEDTITFVAAAGGTRTAPASAEIIETITEFKASNALAELTYYDAIAITSP